MNRAVMNIDEQLSLKQNVASFRCMPKTGIAGSCDTSISPFLGTSILISIGLNQFVLLPAISKCQCYHSILAYAVICPIDLGLLIGIKENLTCFFFCILSAQFFVQIKYIPHLWVGLFVSLIVCMCVCVHVFCWVVPFACYVDEPCTSTKGLYS